MEKTVSMKVKPELDILSTFNFDNMIDAFSYTKDTVFNFRFVLEEMLTNVINYSKCTSDIQVSIIFKYELIIIRICDNGIKFNPLSKEDPDLNEPLANRKNGELGIYLTKNIVQKISYTRMNAYNLLSLMLKTKTKPSPRELHKKLNNLSTDTYFSLLQ